jgi:hypothetical protein
MVGERVIRRNARREANMGENKIASVRPSPLASIVGIAGGIMGMGVGIVFLAAIPADPGPEGFRNFFFLIWFLVCGGIVVYFIRNLATFSAGDKGRIPITASDVVEIVPGEDAAGGNDFELRLRKLEALRKDGLVSEEEFQAKRKQIMDEKW